MFNLHFGNEFYFILSNLITNRPVGCANNTFLTQSAFTLGGFFCKNVTFESFLKSNFPVPVTLKRFLALELVLTFGIIIIFYFYTLLASRTDGNLWSHVGNMFYRKLIQLKHKMLKGLQK